MKTFSVHLKTGVMGTKGGWGVERQINLTRFLTFERFICIRLAKRLKFRCLTLMRNDFSPDEASTQMQEAGNFTLLIYFFSKYNLDPNKISRSSVTKFK